jgi:hypothetical protein
LEELLPSPVADKAGTDVAPADADADEEDEEEEEEVEAEEDGIW